MKAHSHTKTCTQMFQTALFLLAKTWEQRKCLSSSETAKTNRGHYDGLLLSNEKE